MRFFLIRVYASHGAILLITDAFSSTLDPTENAIIAIAAGNWESTSGFFRM